MASTLYYTTVQELKLYLPNRLLGALTQDVEGNYLPENDIISSAIESAEDEVNSYLAKRYTIPVRTSGGIVPSRIKTLVYTITKYLLYTRAALLSAEISQEYDNAIVYLDRIATGRATMPALDTVGFDKNNENFELGNGSVYEGLFKNYRP